MSRQRYRVVPWRGPVSGRLYYRIERSGFLLWREVITCFSEQETNDMLAKLRLWDADGISAADGEGKVRDTSTLPPSDREGK